METQFFSEIRNSSRAKRWASGHPACWGLACCLMMSACSGQGSQTATEISREQRFVSAAAGTVQAFAHDPDMGEFRALAKRARAMLIVPEAVRAAFLLGLESGGGVLVVRGAEHRAWRGPAFYALDGASIGLQMGADASEIICLVMTDRGLQSFYKSSLKIGADASIAAGSDGSRIGADVSPRLSSDLIVFARSKGAFMGLSLQDVVVRVADSANAAYYGRSLRPAEIFEMEMASPHPPDLLQAVDTLTR